MFLIFRLWHDVSSSKLSLISLAEAERRSPVMWTCSPFERQNCIYPWKGRQRAVWQPPGNKCWQRCRSSDNNAFKRFLKCKPKLASQYLWPSFKQRKMYWVWWMPRSFLKKWHLAKHQFISSICTNIKCTRMAPSQWKVSKDFKGCPRGWQMPGFESIFEVKMILSWRFYKSALIIFRADQN